MVTDEDVEGVLLGFGVGDSLTSLWGAERLLLLEKIKNKRLRIVQRLVWILLHKYLINAYSK